MNKPLAKKTEQKIKYNRIYLTTNQNGVQFQYQKLNDVAAMPTKNRHITMPKIKCFQEQTSILK